MYLPHLQCQTLSSWGWFLSVFWGFNPLVYAGFSMSALLTFWLGNSLFGAAVLCTVGYLTAPLASIYWMQLWKQKFLQIMSNVPWGTKSFLFENHHHRVSYTEWALPICSLHKFYSKCWVSPTKINMEFLFSWGNWSAVAPSSWLQVWAQTRVSFTPVTAHCQLPPQSLFSHSHLFTYDLKTSGGL